MSSLPDAALAEIQGQRTEAETFAEVEGHAR